MGVVPTTIIPPRTTRPFIVRPVLQRLVASIDRASLVTVCAAAGSGKTTAMLYWAEELQKAERPLLWLAARAGISNLSTFQNALIAAGVAAGLDWKHLEAAPSGEPLLSALALTDGVRPVLMLDDVQTLPPDVLAFLARMVASAGGALTTIVAARGISQVPIDQTCLPGPLVEVTAADLSLSVQEATELAVLTVGGPVDAADLQYIVRDTQGWAAGIVIASDIYREEKRRKQNSAIHPTEFRHEFAEYFHEEVLDLQPQAVRDFIVDTSILTELTPSACAAVARSDDARPALDAAYSAGLFLNVTDREAGHYRYHRLFRETVLGRLTDRDPARAAELHRRASRYFAEAGDLLEAIEHAHLSRDQAFLAGQLESLSEDIIYSGFLYRLDELGSALPWKLLSRHPMLLLALAWRRTRRLAFASAGKLIEAAKADIEAKRAAGEIDSYELGRLNNAVRHRQIMLDAARDDMIAVEPAAEELLKELGDEHAYLSCTLLAQLMSARRELYHFHDMLKLEAETRRALDRPGSDFASIALKASVAPTLMAQGKTVFARQFLEQALALAQSIQGEGSGLAALPALPLSELLYECGELAMAGNLAERYLPTIRQWGFIDQLASGYLVRARLAAARGDIPAALSGLEEAHLVAIECGLDRMRAFVVAEQVRILIQNGHIEEAESAFAAGDPGVDEEPVPTLRPTRRNESVAIAWLRLEMQRHRLVRARKVAKRWLEFVKHSGAVRSAVTFELLLAEISVLQGNRFEARKAVRAAVEMAQPAGWTRVFIDEGEVIASLINEICAGGPSMDSAAHAFVSRLASLMRHGLVMETEDDGEYGLGSRLARREVDILSMVSGGLRNREIGDRLGLTEGTVKWYMQQIYDKLGVRRRPQAVIRARQLGILH